MNKRLSRLFSDWGFTRRGFVNNEKGEWLLLSQLSIIICHMLPKWPLTNEYLFLSLLGILIFTVGMTLGLKSFIDLGNSLSPLPEPKLNAKLITYGCYKYSRHPLYLSLIIISLGIFVYTLSFVHLILLLLLTKILIQKAKREEKRLKLIHISYNKYIRNTPAILYGIKFLDWR